MTYIANTDLSTRDASGAPAIIAQGQVIDDFATWDKAVQLAHLALGKVRDTNGQGVGNIGVVDGKLSMGVRADVRDDAVTLVPEATKPLPEPTAIVQGFVCQACDKSFTRAADLRRHAKVHGL